jgi:hypothetical protein
MNHESITVPKGEQETTHLPDYQKYLQLARSPLQITYAATWVHLCLALACLVGLRVLVATGESVLCRVYPCQISIASRGWGSATGVRVPRGFYL